MKQLFTGHAKELFEEWYINLTYQYPKLNTCIETRTVGFYMLPLSMQIGVVEDFAESLGYYVYFVGNTGAFYEYEINIKGTTHYIYEESKQQAREELIKELNKIINGNSI